MPRTETGELVTPKIKGMLENRNLKEDFQILCDALDTLQIEEDELLTRQCDDCYEDHYEEDVEECENCGSDNLFTYTKFESQETSYGGYLDMWISGIYRITLGPGRFVLLDTQEFDELIEMILNDSVQKERLKLILTLKFKALSYED